jgi:hypothetical protein
MVKNLIIIMVLIYNPMLILDQGENALLDHVIPG